MNNEKHFVMMKKSSIGITQRAFLKSLFFLHTPPFTAPLPRTTYLPSRFPQPTPSLPLLRYPPAPPSPPSLTWIHLCDYVWYQVFKWRFSRVQRLFLHAECCQCCAYWYLLFLTRVLYTPCRCTLQQWLNITVMALPVSVYEMMVLVIRKLSRSFPLFWKSFEFHCTLGLSLLYLISCYYCGKKNTKSVKIFSHNVLHWIRYFQFCARNIFRIVYV